MSSPFVGEIRMFAGNFAPAGWMFCEGQLLPISENEVLFQVIGTTYGGDGQETFALPDLQGRVPIHQGNSFVIGQTGGVEQVTLTTNQIPNHTHNALGTNSAGNTALASGVWAASADTSINPYGAAAAIDSNMSPQAISPVGGSQPHDNMLPYLAVNFIISLFGIYPAPP